MNGEGTRAIDHHLIGKGDHTTRVDHEIAIDVHLIAEIDINRLADLQGLDLIDAVDGQAEAAACAARVAERGPRHTQHITLEVAATERLDGDRRDHTIGHDQMRRGAAARPTEQRDTRVHPTDRDVEVFNQLAARGRQGQRLAGNAHRREPGTRC